MKNIASIKVLKIVAIVVVSLFLISANDKNRCEVVSNCLVTFFNNLQVKKFMHVDHESKLQYNIYSTKFSANCDISFNFVIVDSIAERLSKIPHKDKNDIWILKYKKFGSYIKMEIFYPQQGAIFICNFKKNKSTIKLQKLEIYHI